MILYVLSLLPAAIVDARLGVVANRFLIAPVVIELLITCNIKVMAFCFLIYIGFLSSQKYWVKYIGGADIKVLISIFYLLKLKVLIVINFAALMASCYLLVTKQKKAHFIPFILMGLILTLLCN